MGENLRGSWLFSLFSSVLFVFTFIGEVSLFSSIANAKVPSNRSSPGLPPAAPTPAPKRSPASVKATPSPTPRTAALSADASCAEKARAEVADLIDNGSADKRCEKEHIAYQQASCTEDKKASDARANKEYRPANEIEINLKSNELMACTNKRSNADVNRCEEYRTEIRKSGEEVVKQCSKAIRKTAKDYSCATKLNKCREDYENDLEVNNGIPIFKYDGSDPDDACKRGLMGGQSENLKAMISSSESKVEKSTERLDDLRTKQRESSDDITDKINDAYAEIADASSDADDKTAAILSGGEDGAAKNEANETDLAAKIKNLEDDRDALLNQMPVSAQTKLISAINRTKAKCAEEATKSVLAQKERDKFRKKHRPGQLLDSATGSERQQLLIRHRQLIRECSNVDTIDAQNEYNLALRSIDSQLKRIETQLTALRDLQIKSRFANERQQLLAKQQLVSIQSNLERKRQQLLVKIQGLQGQKALNDMKMNNDIALESYKLRQYEQKLHMAETSYANSGGAGQKDYDNFMDALSSAQAYDYKKAQAVTDCCTDDETRKILGNICPPLTESGSSSDKAAPGSGGIN